MVKKVIYTGERHSEEYGYLDTSQLIIGKEYEVTISKDRGYRIDYILKGIKGTFPSDLFEEVKSKPNIYMAFAYEPPKLGKEYRCYKLGFDGGRPTQTFIQTSKVRYIEYISNNIYQVNTENSIYLVNVNKWQIKNVLDISRAFL